MTVRRLNNTNRRSDSYQSLDVNEKLKPTDNITSSGGLRANGSNGTSSAQNVRSAAMARPSPCAVVDVTSCTSTRTILGRVAPSSGRMILGCLVVWGYCLSSCLGLLLSPEPYPTGMTKPRDHAHGILIANTFQSHDKGSTSKNAQISSDKNLQTTHNHWQDDMESLIQNSKVHVTAKPLPSSKDKEMMQRKEARKNFSKSDKISTVPTKSNDDLALFTDPSMSRANKEPTGTPASHYGTQAKPLNIALKPPPLFHLQPSTDKSSKMIPPRGEKNLQSLDFYKRDSNNHIGDHKVHHSLGKDAIFLDISKTPADLKQNPENARHDTSSLENIRFDSKPSKDNHNIPSRNTDGSAKPRQSDGAFNIKTEDESVSGDNLSFLIQETVQKMQSRFDYLKYLQEDLEVRGDESGDDEDEDASSENYSDKVMEFGNIMIPAYLNSNNSLINDTHTPRHSLKIEHMETSDLNQYENHGKNDGLSRGDYPDKSRDQGDVEETVYESKVMSAVVKALALGKVPEDVYFWRNMSRLLDSNSYLSRTRRSPYRSRYLRRRRPRPYSRSSSRYVALLRARFAITYNHVRPCLRRDRFYCMNGGTCVFVVALDIKTCR